MNAKEYFWLCVVAGLACVVFCTIAGMGIREGYQEITEQLGRAVR
jgi:hypothetical protein